MGWRTTVRRREISPLRRDEFVARGHRLREFFPHSAYVLPKPGPDGARLARSMCGESASRELWEIVLIADPSLLSDLPRELLFDRDLLWHEQHFGQPGQVAAVDIVIDGTEMWTMAHQSDLVQRIGRRRDYKTKIEKRFAGWHAMLLNALLAFASERGVTHVFTPTSRLALANTDRTRSPAPELFERLYDRDVNRLYVAAAAEDWSRIDVAANRERLVVPEPREDVVELERTICLCHDVEAGFGHVGIDDELARQASSEWRESLRRILEIENRAGVKGTYNVVGSLLPEVRDQIQAGRHCVGFHSWDHRLPPKRFSPDRLRGALRLRATSPPADQLARCRDVDYRIKGYRPPQSRITPELADKRLLWHNFEWLASSSGSLGVDSPVLRDGLVRIPISQDDWPIYRRQVDYDAWTEEIAELVATRDVTAFSVHDCYAPLWLDRYAELLARLSELGVWRTLDEVSATATLAEAV